MLQIANVVHILCSWAILLGLYMFFYYIYNPNHRFELNTVGAYMQVRAFINLLITGVSKEAGNSILNWNE